MAEENKMNLSLFIIGTELTRGVIKDLHTSFLASNVSKMGFHVLRSVVVPDDGSIECVLRLAAHDSDVLLVKQIKRIHVQSRRNFFKHLQ